MLLICNLFFRDKEQNTFFILHSSFIIFSIIGLSLFISSLIYIVLSGKLLNLFINVFLISLIILFSFSLLIFNF